MKQYNTKSVQTNKHRINDAITAPQVLIINKEGQTEGPCSVQKALQMARDQGLDLVEVAPQANPPVCKILDYGKFRYTLSKKTKATPTKKQILKEIRMQPKISDHDLKFKTNHVQSFLEEGNKVKVTIRFKGREFAHTELGEVTLRKVLELITCNYTLDKSPLMEGRVMNMLLSPSAKGAKKKAPATEKENTPTSKSSNSNSD